MSRYLRAIQISVQINVQTTHISTEDFCAWWQLVKRHAISFDKHFRLKLCLELRFQQTLSPIRVTSFHTATVHLVWFRLKFLWYRGYLGQGKCQYRLWVEGEKKSQEEGYCKHVIRYLFCKQALPLVYCYTYFYQISKLHISDFHFAVPIWYYG